MTRELALTSLQRLAAEKPATKMGQIRWAWPEIQAALGAGHTLQSVHQRLAESGIEIEYKTLSLYIGRLERREGRRNQTAGTAAHERENVSSQSLTGGPIGETVDPFANIRNERDKKEKRRFDYHPFSTDKNLLE